VEAQLPPLAKLRRPRERGGKAERRTGKPSL